MIYESNFNFFLLTDFYQLKLAFQNDFSDNVNRLFSYFLTEEPLAFPFLIHGTFELDQNRKRISNDKNENGISRNEFILKRLATLIINTAKHFSKETICFLVIGSTVKRPV